MVRNDESYSYLAQDFRNMIEDPIVDSLLKQKYNFDLLSKYKENLKLPKREIDQMDKEPIRKARRLELMINFIKKELCWNLIKGSDTEKRWTDFQKAYKLKCPNVWGNEQRISTLYL